MKVFVLGANGMLGHKMMQVLGKDHIVAGSVRGKGDLKRHLIGGVDAYYPETVCDAIRYVDPDVIVNCIGIVKQLPEANNAYKSIAINAFFPHQLERECALYKMRLIHMSSDCVFSGKVGNYTERDFSDAEDLYGKTKYLGEVIDSNRALTIRTSIIGREINTSHGLLEWFLKNNHGSVDGYKNAIFSGLTTLALSRIISTLISDHSALHGLYQISSLPISKCNLLCMIRDEYKLDIKINPVDNAPNRRDLSPCKFIHDVGIMAPTWDTMIKDMHEDVI